MLQRIVLDLSDNESSITIIFSYESLVFTNLYSFPLLSFGICGHLLLISVILSNTSNCSFYKTIRFFSYINANSS